MSGSETPGRPKRRHSSGDSALTPNIKQKPTIVKTPDYKMEKKIDQMLKQNEEVLKQNAAVLKQNEEIKEMLKGVPGMKVQLDKVTSTIKNHEDSIEFNSAEIKGLQEKMTQNEIRIKDLEEEAMSARGDALRWKLEVDRLANKVEDLECYSRRENLVFFGISEEPNENCSAKVLSFIEKKLEVKGRILLSRAHRLGKKQDTPTSRPIIVRFLYPPDRERVWRARGKLVKSNFYVKEDYPEKVEKERERLIPFQRHAKRLGYDSGVSKGKLYVSGRAYTTRNLENLPEDLQPRSICEQIVSDQGQDYLLFSGMDTPFSNWYKTPLMMDGVSYVSVEQSYFHSKAILAHDPSRAAQIMTTNNPKRMRKIAADINLDKKEWESKDEEIMKRALRAKFQQNDDLKTILLETEGQTLVEGTRNPRWGCGVSLYSKGSTDPSKWTGGNLLGKLLMELRRELK